VSDALLFDSRGKMRVMVELGPETEPLLTVYENTDRQATDIGIYTLDPQSEKETPKTASLFTNRGNDILASPQNVPRNTSNPSYSIQAIALFALFVQMSLAQIGSTGSQHDQQHIYSEQAWKALQPKNPASPEWKKFKAGLVLDSQRALAKFGYGTVFTASLDERTQQALRSYQRRNHLPVTGDVDGPTWVHLEEDGQPLINTNTCR
jgi:hypothetical protein